LARHHFVLVLLLPLLLYARTIGFDYVAADDVNLIAGNQAFLRDLGNVPRAFERSYFETEREMTTVKTYYRPVAIVSFMLDAQRGGTDPAVYHATNVVLHTVVTALLLALMAAWGVPPVAALVAAITFAVHPLNVQAVAWIADRNDLLLAVFTIVSLLAWSRAGSAGALAPAWLAAHVVTFALALFSKESGIVVPILAALYTRGVVRVPFTRLLQAVLLADATVIAAWAVLRAKALAGSTGGMSAAESIGVAASNLPHLLVHAGKILVPARLNVSPGIDLTGELLGLIAIATLSVVALRWLSPRWAFFAGVWALLFLLPTLAVAGLPAYEHRMYLPLVGILAAFAHLPGRRRASLVAAGLLAVSFAARTFVRQDVFRNPVTYWTDATRDRQFAPVAHVNLGQLEERAGRPAEARRHYVRALEIDPLTPKAHNNLGVMLMQMGDAAGAERQFRMEVERHPANAEAWFNLGLHADMHGRPEEAARYWERAIEANRAFVPAYDKLEAFYAARGDEARARDYRQRGKAIAKR
jgi:tetratricopeptide (TPR) repeat protein